MSTPFRVRVASRSCILAAAVASALAACSDSKGATRAVSYAGLDRPTGWDAPPPVEVGIVADTTGPGALAGRAFVESLRAGFEAAGERDADGFAPKFALHVFDDRGREDGVRGAAARLETDPSVHFVLVAPGSRRAAIAAELAPRTVVVCPGCARDEATREGVFVVSGGNELGATTAQWIRAAMRGTRVWNSRALAIGLRAAEPARGYARSEGSAPALEPELFREPPAKPAAR